jgi:hypothetical protein
MTRAFCITIGFCLLLASCTQRMICPAYQSAFIYDKDELRKKFSYFENDSSPKVYSASKTKYLIAESTTYRKKVRTMSTVPAKKVFVHVPDSISGKGDQDSVITADLDRAARSVIDSTVFVEESQPDSVAQEDDSTYVITKDREVRVLRYNMPDSLEFDTLNNRFVAQKPEYYVDEVGFNTEQDNYMWYLRHSLVLPDVRLAKLQSEDGGKSSDVRKGGKKKGVFGFFKNLFRKESAPDVDSAELDLNRNQEEQFDFIDTTATESPEVIQQEPKRRKKDRLTPNEEETNPSIDQPQAEKPKKKKKKKKEEQPKDQPKDEKKPEEEDDGF